MAKVHNTCYKVAKTLTTAGKVAGFGLAATAFGAATLPMTVGGALQYYGTAALLSTQGGGCCD